MLLMSVWDILSIGGPWRSKRLGCLGINVRPQIHHDFFPLLILNENTVSQLVKSWENGNAFTLGLRDLAFFYLILSHILFRTLPRLYCLLLPFSTLLCLLMFKQWF